ncbi:MAG TPA: ThuA domain-containing protein, partial [Planctomycetaceae bacterium]
VTFDKVRGVLDSARRAQIEQVRLQTASPKKVVFVAGGPSHDYGSHEHRAGCLLLEGDLKASGLPVETTVVTNGWPKDESVFDDAAAVVIYADGGGGHPAVRHLDTLRELSDRGVGIVCIHYAVEVPKGEPGEAFLDAIGGYFETHWSVNPWWTADYERLPEHSVTRGVEPFRINDEWYYHMRFREGLEGVTPILTDLPPAETLSRPDGPHSGNPAVREAIARREPQHVAWAYERPNGGRGFGFTGGHVHWNWGHPEFRQLVLNAIVWSAGVDVPQEGVPVRTLTVSDLEANQDEPPPPSHNPARIQAMLDEWNR